MQDFVRTLNHLYLDAPALWENDSDWGGFQWIAPDDCDNSVISFRRISRKGQELLVICNFCPVLREGYRLGVPKAGWYVPVLNSDDERFGGAGTELLPLHAEKLPSHGQAHSAAFRVPPLSVSIYRYQRTDPRK